MQPHALLVPYPETGHINPLMQLAIHLASNGVCVTFVNTSYNHQRILQSNAGRLPSDLGLPIRLVDVPDCLSENDNRDHDLNNLTKVIANVGHPLEELMDKMSAAGERITCIISDIAATQTSEIAKKRGIPRVAFWPPNASVYSCFCHAIHAISEGTFPKNGIVRHDEMISFPALPSLPGWKVPWMIGDEATANLIFSTGSEGVAGAVDAEWILINSVHELEADVLDAIAPHFGHLLPIGPILPLDVLPTALTTEKLMTVSLWPEDDACLEWLNAQKPRSVLYVSLGSIAILSKEQLHEVAIGLEASGLSILWVVRDDLTGIKGASLPQGFLDRTQNRIRVVSWCPQLLVLSHEAVGGFLTHGGWNSSMEALSMGVPMLVWPHLGDQFLNAEFIVAKWGVGLELSHGGTKDFIGSKRIESMVRKFMGSHEGEVVRAKAKEMRQQILKVVAKGGSSNNNLQSFVTWVKHQAELRQP